MGSMLKYTKYLTLEMDADTKLSNSNIHFLYYIFFALIPPFSTPWRLNQTNIGQTLALTLCNILLGYEWSQSCISERSNNSPLPNPKNNAETFLVCSSHKC